MAAAESLAVVVEPGPPGADAAPLLGVTTVVVAPDAAQRREGFGDAAAVHVGIVEDAQLSKAAGLDDTPHDEGERLLNVDLEARARLHEAATALARPVKPLRRGDLPRLLEVALVARDDLDGRDGTGTGTGPSPAVVAIGTQPCLLRPACVVDTRLGLHVDQVVEVGESLQAVARGDVVDE